MWQAETYFLIELLGPTTLPLTHAVGYVEKSTRYVVSWAMPPAPPSLSSANDSGFSCSDAATWLASAVLAPYNTFSKADHAAIRHPDLVKDPLKGLECNELQIAPHDPTKDAIRVFLLPKTAETLMKGIGIGATWVQVVPIARKEEMEPWWYVEQVEQIIPSFWTERQS